MIVRGSVKIWVSFLSSSHSCLFYTYIVQLWCCTNGHYLYFKLVLLVSSVERFCLILTSLLMKFSEEVKNFQISKYQKWNFQKLPLLMISKGLEKFEINFLNSHFIIRPTISEGPWKFQIIKFTKGWIFANAINRGIFEGSQKCSKLPWCFTFQTICCDIYIIM